MSSRGVVRGFHYQPPPYSQSKLIRVVCGRVIDVALDIRRGSPTFGKHVTVELSGANKRQLLIPRGFAHGFIALEDRTVFAYKCDRPYMPSYDRAINPVDPNIEIHWGIDVGECIVSAKDAASSLLADAEVYDYSQRASY